jgi:hypothetical protein
VVGKVLDQNLAAVGDILGLFVSEITEYFAGAVGSATGTVPSDTMPERPAKPLILLVFRHLSSLQSNSVIHGL